MKKTIIITALSFLSLAVSAQDARSPKWVSEQGYWVVETKGQEPKSNIVYFYNNNDELIYKENVEGVVIRLNKRSVKMKLKKVLDQSLIAYAARHKVVENEMLVAALISKH